MTGKMFGYIRVSTKEQNVNRQVIALQKEGIERANIFTDKISGSNFKRPQYKQLMKILQKDDILIIKSIDRLGRNYNEMLQQWSEITKIKKAHIKVIDTPILNTVITFNSLTDNFVCDIVLLILAYQAELELQNIKQRQSEGITSAKIDGKHIGRPKKSYPRHFKEIYSKWKAKEISSLLAMRELKLKKSTFYRLVKNFTAMKGGTLEK